MKPNTTEPGFAHANLFVTFITLTGLLSLSVRHAAAQAPLLRLDSKAGLLRLTLNGEPIQNYRVESATHLDGAWQTSLQFTLTGSQFEWFDSQGAGSRARFYRAVQLAAPPEPERAEDFRLLDQAGKAHRLQYWTGDTNVAAFVLFFTARSPAGAADEVTE